MYLYPTLYFTFFNLFISDLWVKNTLFFRHLSIFWSIFVCKSTAHAAWFIVSELVKGGGHCSQHTVPACSGNGCFFRWGGSRGSRRCSRPGGWSAWSRAVGSCPSSCACCSAWLHPAYWWTSGTNKKNRKREGGGARVAATCWCLFTQSQNRQQVTLSPWKQQLQHAGANWRVGGGQCTLQRTGPGRL